MRTIKEDRDRVRMRPTNYIPDTSIEGVNHIAFEIIDNSIDEAINDKKANVVKIIIDEDTKRVTVIDQGRGIPHKTKKDEEDPFLNACTKLNTSAKFDNGSSSSYRVSGGTNGIGLKLAVFLSKECIVTSERDGAAEVLTFKDGILVSHDIKKSKNRGTTVTYILDDKLMDLSEFSFNRIKGEIKEKAYLFPNVEFQLIQIQKGSVSKTKSYKGKTIVDAVSAMKPDLSIIYLEADKTVSIPNNKLNKLEDHRVIIHVAFSYKEELIENKGDEHIHLPSFVNSIKTTMGGTHVQGLKEGLSKFFRQYMGDGKTKIVPSDITMALCGVVSVQLEKTEFRGQYKDQLNSESARIAVRDAVYEYLLKEKDTTVKKMASFIKEVAKSREASKKSREKKPLTAFSKESVDKYHPLIETDNTFARELYLAEGDSALGSITQARDINNHAVLPLGRPTNTIDKNYSDLANIKSSFNDLMFVIGIELGKKFKREDLNFDKIIFALDGDIDGEGMVAANLALMARFTPQLFEWGMVYRLVPPLYKFMHKGEMRYITSQKEFNKFVVNSYSDKNEVRISRVTLKKKDIARLFELNFYYSKELDKLAKKIVGTPLLVEKLVWYYNETLEYGKKDVAVLKEVLKDFPYVDVIYKKGVITIEGTDGNAFVHVSINKFFKKSVRKFKEIQKGNITAFDYYLNGEKVSLYTVIKSLEKYMPKDIERIKGLGELDPYEFKATCMDHDKRTLLKLKMSEHPKNDLEVIYTHYSRKNHYKELRAKIMQSIIVDEELLDT